MLIKYNNHLINIIHIKNTIRISTTNHINSQLLNMGYGVDKQGKFPALYNIFLGIGINYFRINFMPYTKIDDIVINCISKNIKSHKIKKILIDDLLRKIISLWNPFLV